jgi:hypothetical protein
MKQFLGFSVFYGCSKCIIVVVAVFCLFAKNMDDRLLEQRINVKLYVNCFHMWKK